MKRIAALGLLVILLAASLTFPPTDARAQSNLPVVHAVLFYSPACGHCQLVINDTLLPMVEKYGEQLQIVGLDINQPQGSDMFQVTLQKFGLEGSGVPFLVIDDTFLIGSVDIPEQFPGLVESYLAQGGVDWPDIPGLLELLPTPSESAVQTASPPATAAPVSVSPAPSTPAPGLDISREDLTWQERFAHDPAGNTLSVIVLISMLGALVWAFRLFQKTGGASLKEGWSWIIPALCIIGTGVAGYLAYVEVTQVPAVCGPVGDCNTVQQSEQARLFGILPIGVMGLFGYAAIILAWLVGRYTDGRLSKLALLALLGMTVFGTFFSIYLTFLEPFVIGATCAWCLTSAVLMTILMMLAVKPAKGAWGKLKRSKKS